MRAFATAVGLVLRASLLLSAGASAADDLDWIEAQWQGGTGDHSLTLYGTYDLPVFQPVLDAFVATHPEYQVNYRVASSTALDQRVSQDRQADADLIFSSAVALQLKSVNGGQAQRFTDSPDAWRGQLLPLAIEPVVSVYDTTRARWVEGINTRTALSDALTKAAGFSRFTGVMYDPRQSGVGYLLATQDVEQSLAFWPMIDAVSQAGGWLLSCCSAQMIDKVESGQADMAYNVLGSYAQARVDANPSLAIKVFGDYQLVIPRTAWIPRWSDNAVGAAQFIEFVRSPRGQSFLPDGAQLDRLNNQIEAPRKPIRLTPALTLYLDPAKRRQFLQTWDTLMSAPD